jgi:hypothetical protein
MKRMNKAKKYIFVIAVVVIVAALMINIGLQLKAIGLLERSQVQCQSRKSLPCESVPLRWAVENYGCANSLLLSMNVTNVKFNPPHDAVAPVVRNRSMLASKK